MLEYNFVVVGVVMIMSEWYICICECGSVCVTQFYLWQYCPFRHSLRVTCCFVDVDLLCVRRFTHGTYIFRATYSSGLRASQTNIFYMILSIKHECMVDAVYVVRDICRRSECE